MDDYILARVKPKPGHSGNFWEDAMRLDGWFQIKDLEAGDVCQNGQNLAWVMRGAAIIVSNRAGGEGEMLWSKESKGLGSEVVYCSTVSLQMCWSNLMNQQNHLIVRFPGPSKDVQMI